MATSSHAAAEEAPSTRWLEAATAYVAGEAERAAELCADIGALPEADLLSAGRGPAQLFCALRSPALSHSVTLSASSCFR